MAKHDVHVLPLFKIQIWNLMSGQELKMFELGAPVYSVTMDHSELSLYAGDSLGNVYCIDLQAEVILRML